jgi:hypothetical protein
MLALGFFFAVVLYILRQALMDTNKTKRLSQGVPRDYV